MDTQHSREFARLDARLEARLREIGPEEAAALETRLGESPTVWALENETVLENMAAGVRSGNDAVLAESILELAKRLGQFRNRESDPGGPMGVATVIQLSGGGALLETHHLLSVGARVELRLIDDGSGVPPLQILAEVVHATDETPPTAGLRFEAVHPLDRERLVRFLYLLQRRELRRAHAPEGETG